MTEELRNQLMTAYDLARSLEEANEDAEEMKRAIIDDLRSAMDNLNAYEDTLSKITSVEMDISLSAYIYVKHREDQDPSEAAVRFVYNELNIYCYNAAVDVETIDAVRSVNIDSFSSGEDIDITDED